MKPIKTSVQAALIVCAGIFHSVVFAGDDVSPVFDVYSITAEASAEIRNDLMVATLVVQEEDKDAAVLADRVNNLTRWASEVVSDYPALQLQTRDYQTYPRYDASESRRLIGWSAKQTLRIESGDLVIASKVIAQLQERLKVQGIMLTASEETRRLSEDELIGEALSAFKDRSVLVQESMGAADYRVMDVSIDTGQGAGVMFDASPRTAGMLRSTMIAETTIEPGTSRVSVKVYGRIQLE